MAISWHWAFGPESAADLQLYYGFTFFSGLLGSVPLSGAAETYSYSGSPTRYSMARRNIGVLILPAASYPSTAKGWVSIPAKDLAAPSLTVSVRLIDVYGSGSTRRIYVDVGADQKSLRLWVSNVFKESTTPFDWTDWKYVSLQWSMSTTTWSGRIFVDGVAETASYNETIGTVAETSGAIQLGSPTIATTSQWLLPQIICHDDNADAGEVPRFVTRVQPNADGTNIGTWTPSVGGTDFGVLATPLNTTTYTENTSPTALDRVEVLTNGGGSDLDTALGTTTSAIDSVIVHGYSTGQAVTARVKVGDGTVSETAGANGVISVGSTSYTYAVANLKPSGGSWAGTDSPDYIYEVVST